MERYKLLLTVQTFLGIFPQLSSWNCCKSLRGHLWPPVLFPESPSFNFAKLATHHLILVLFSFCYYQHCQSPCDLWNILRWGTCRGLLAVSNNVRPVTLNKFVDFFCMLLSSIRSARALQNKKQPQIRLCSPYFLYFRPFVLLRRLLHGFGASRTI